LCPVILILQEGTEVFFLEKKNFQTKKNINSLGNGYGNKSLVCLILKELLKLWEKLFTASSIVV
jgi:hypothetical protein